MMKKDAHDLVRVERFIERNPECDVIIIANKKVTANEYWRRIEENTGIRKRPYIVTNSNTWDGFPILDSLVLKVGRWWENRNAVEFIEQSRLAKLTLPITYIPPTMKGGE